MPKLIIQPLIENAIKYGVETNMLMRLTFKCQYIFEEVDQICIYVKNDGSPVSGKESNEGRNLQRFWNRIGEY